MKLRTSILATLAALALGSACSPQAGDIDHVLVIRVDGLHAYRLSAETRHKLNTLEQTASVE